MLLLLACREPAPADTPAETADTVETADTAPTVPDGPFHPELVARPRLVALPDDRDTIRTRIADDTASADLYAQVVASCASTAPVPTPDPLDPGATWAAAAIARNCAFLGWLDEDPTHTAKAVSILGTLPPDAYALADASDDVHLSTALGLAVQAWDLAVAVDPAADPAPVLALVRSTWDRYAVTESLWLAAWRNNHNVKMASAFGLAALAFNDEPEARAWASFAQTELHFLVDELAAADGGWSEGPYYQMYSSMQLLPYLRAWHRALGDTGELFAVDCATHLGECDDTPIAVGDLWEDPRWVRSFEWNRDVAMPDGLRPPVDDGLAVGFPSGMLEGETFRGDWLRTGFATWAGDMTADLLSAYTGGGLPPPPDCVVREESGFTTLELNDTWVMLLAEPGGVTDAGGHEHEDAGTIQVYMGGKYLVMDPGYAGWDDRNATNGYDQHSGLLIDGAGPVDPSLEWSGEGCEAGVTLEWAGHTWTRRVRNLGWAVQLVDEVSSPAELRFQLATRDGRGTWDGSVLRWDTTELTLVSTDTTGQTTGWDAPEYARLVEHDTVTVASDGRTLTLFVQGAWAAEVGDDTITVAGSTFGDDFTVSP